MRSIRHRLDPTVIRGRTIADIRHGGDCNTQTRPLEFDACFKCLEQWFGMFRVNTVDVRSEYETKHNWVCISHLKISNFGRSDETHGFGASQRVHNRPSIIGWWGETRKTVCIPPVNLGSLVTFCRTRAFQGLERFVLSNRFHRRV